jgi:PAS domain S-box-containing protein
LLQREDIRDRFLRLAGTADLQRSTAALDDAATRLGRFFLMQLLLNTGFGIVIVAALFAIGVPNAVLWGILAGVMRFVPFVGSLIAAFFPVAVAAAADPGWSMPLMTAGLFLVAEPAAGQIIEPLVYGQRTGLSPVAVVLSTLFWTLLWGPVGLLLATPLTVCLVVLGKHIEGLKFIDVLLGDEPPLLAEERFYQRLLSGDATDAADNAEDQLKTQSLSAYYDAVAVKALVLAQTDAAEGKLSDERQQKIRATMPSGEAPYQSLLTQNATNHAKQELQWFASIIESSGDAIISKSLDGVITSWNNGAQRIFGYTAAEVIGKAINILIPPDRPNEEPDILARVRRGERIDHYETVRMRKDGSRVDISLTVSPVKTPNRAFSSEK